MAKVEIYGEIVAAQDEWLIENGCCNLSYVNKQLNAAGGEAIEVLINSPGGDVDEGFAIYSALRRYAKDNNVSVTTRADGRVASIATMIFLAGDRRIASQYIDPFIHNAWMITGGDAEELKKVSEELERVTERMARFYAEHTNLTYEEARELMAAETSITPEEALNIRFATEIEEVLRPAALRRHNTNAKVITKKNKDMSNKSEKNLLDKIKALFNEGAKALEVFTSTSESLVFPDLEEGQTPEVGDKAEIDGKPAEGRITLQDGTVYVFVAGELTEIIEEEEEEETAPDIEALKKENEELKALIEAQAKEITGIKASQEKFEKQWQGLKNLVSSHTASTKDNQRKASTEGKPKGSLAGAASRLKDR